MHLKFNMAQIRGNGTVMQSSSLFSLTQIYLHTYMCAQADTHIAPKTGCLVIRSKYLKGIILCPLLLERSPTVIASKKHSIYIF